MTRTDSSRSGWIIVYSMIALYLLLARSWMGISLYDDSMYMDWTRWMSPSGFIHALSYDPLYVMWLKGLGHIFPDPIWRYMVNWGVLVIVVTSVPLWLGNRLAWLYALALIALPYFGVCDYVSLFAAIFLVAGLGLVLRWKLSLSAAIFTAFCACFVTAYVRPEFQYGVFIAAPFVLATLVLDLRRHGRGTLPRALAIKSLVFAALLSALFYSVSHTNSKRSGFAFAQHVNLRASEKGLLAGDPWSSNYAQQLYHLDVEHHPDLSEATITDFFRANPRLFFSHIVDNLKDLRTVRVLLGIFLFAALPFFLERFRTLRPAAVCLFLVSVPVMSVILLIYPRPHYINMVLPSLLLLVLQFIPPQPRFDTPPAWKALIVGVPLMVLTVQSRHWYLPPFDSIVASNIPLIHCIRDTEKAAGAGDLTLYDTVTIQADDVYFPTRRTRLFPDLLTDWPAFTSSIQSKRPAWIIAGPSLADTLHQSPQAVASFLENNLGYVPHACPASTGVTIFTRPTL